MEWYFSHCVIIQDRSEKKVANIQLTFHNPWSTTQVVLCSSVSQQKASIFEAHFARFSGVQPLGLYALLLLALKWYDSGLIPAWPMVSWPVYWVLGPTAARETQLELICWAESLRLVGTSWAYFFNLKCLSGTFSCLPLCWVPRRRWWLSTVAPSFEELRFPEWRLSYCAW